MPRHRDRYTSDVEPCHKAGIRSMIVAPLSHEGIDVGTLKIVAKEPDAFSDGDAFISSLCRV